MPRKHPPDEAYFRVRRKYAISVAALLVGGLVLWMALSTRGRQLAWPVTSPYAVADSQFVRSMNALVGDAFVSGNRITPLQNGDQAFPAMFAAIAGARESITFECAYFKKGELAPRIAAALSERARAGVKVHALLDWAGAPKVRKEDVDAMRDAGVEVEIYHRARPHQPQRSTNRSHRRIMVVDGRIGFTGGMCIADYWMGNAQDRDHWRDTHYRVEGPVVAQMQAAFMDNWREQARTVMHGDRYFPRLDSAGSLLAQVVTSGPDEGSENVRLVYLFAIAAARQSILVQNPYFVPDDMLRDALIDARRRGVSVEIMVPGPVMDAKVTSAASRSRWGPMLEAGIRIYQYQPTMLHMKVMIVDSTFVTTGSANFDNRSFRINDEINLGVYDAGFARHLAEVFRADVAHSKEMTLADWNARPWHTRLAERLAAIVRAQL